MTEGEKIMWNRLRFNGPPFRFRRQFAAGPYVLDFYCPECRLCIEIDGEFHAEREDRDKIRDDWLKDHGIATLRIPSWDVFEQIESVMSLIWQVCDQRANGS
jgi:very-short-patch-repair endonuclease